MPPVGLGIEVCFALAIIQKPLQQRRKQPPPTKEQTLDAS
jgi:hypothetical protein